MGNESKIIVKVDPEIRELIPRFLLRMNEKAESLASAIERKDFPAIAGLAHRMKGSAEGYGFHALTEMAARLESAAENNRAADARKIIQEIAGFISKAEVVYES